MKSKKIVAMIVAFAAFMAVATSGLAATTTYNYKTNGYVDVEVDVSAEAGKEVTYLVETPSEIVYIDQQTADVNTGAVEFNYKILASKLADVTATVKFGTDGSITPSASENLLAFADANVTGDNIAAVTYWKDADCKSDAINDTAKLGTGDVVYAKIEPAANYKLVSYTKNGGEDQQFTSNIIPVAYNDVIVVTTEEIVVGPTVNIFDESEVTSSSEIIGDADENKPVEDNSGNVIDYSKPVVNKFVKAQNVEAGKKIVLKCANPEDGSDIWEFPVVAESFNGSLEKIAYYLVRFVQGDSEINLSGVDFSYEIK